MPISSSYRVLVLVLGVCTFFPLASAVAQPISPDDPSISGSLQLWLRNPGTDFDGTTWLDSSGNARHSVAAGTDAPGTLSSVTSVSGSYSAQTFDTVNFSGAINDSMVSSNLNGNVGSSDWTIFMVYGVNGTNGLNRPGGIGSRRQGPANGHLNLGNDGSLRFDNGNNTSNPLPESDGDLFLRTVRLDSGSMSQWYDGVVDYLNDVTPSGGTIPNPTSNDEFYIGDLRVAPSVLNDVAEVAVFNSALTDAQIDGVNEHLLNNLQQTAVIPEPASVAIWTMLLAGGFAGWFIKRRRKLVSAAV